MKMLIAARSLKGTWSPGKHWGPEPVVVDADADLQAFLKEYPEQFVSYPLEKATEPKK